MGDKIIGGVPESVIREHQETKAATAEAGSVPMPGALREAFAVLQNIKVGDRVVRPVVDIDFEFLQALDHPFFKMAMGIVQYGDKMSDLRGPNAWQLCFIFTHSVDEVETLMESGVDEVKKAAKKEYSRMQMIDLIDLQKAIWEQASKYWKPVIGYGAASVDESETPAAGELKKNSPVKVQA